MDGVTGPAAHRTQVGGREMILDKIKDWFRPSLECDTCKDEYKVSYERHSYYQRQKHVYYGDVFECPSCQVSWFLYGNPEGTNPEYPVGNPPTRLEEIGYYRQMAEYKRIVRAGWLPTE